MIIILKALSWPQQIWPDQEQPCKKISWKTWWSFVDRRQAELTSDFCAQLFKVVLQILHRNALKIWIQLCELLMLFLCSMLVTFLLVEPTLFILTGEWFIRTSIKNYLCMHSGAIGKSLCRPIMAITGGTIFEDLTLNTTNMIIFKKAVKNVKIQNYIFKLQCKQFIAWPFATIEMSD